MLTTTRRQIQYPDPGTRADRADIALHISYATLAADVDVLFNQGTDAARIAAAHQSGGGRFWWASDTGIMWYDDGTAWHTVGSIAPGAVTGGMIAAGAIMDVNVAANAAIQVSKLAGFPNLRAQNLNGDGSWSRPVLAGINTQAANYVLSLADSNGLVEMNVGGANTVTVPADATASFPVGSEVTIAQIGAGVTQLVAAGGVTLRSYNNNSHIAGQYGVASVIKRATNDWWAAGNLVP